VYIIESNIINKLIRKTCRTRERVSNHPLGLADAIIYIVVVHQHLALSVVPIPLWEGSELLACPPLTHRILGPRILNEPIDLPKKVLLLGQVNVMCLVGLYRLLWHLQVVQGSMVGMFDSILYHFMCSLVEDNVSHVFANAFRQTKIFLRAREN
jgi:hypothetical protein